MAAPSPCSHSTVLMYIDDSNIFESARKYSGTQKGYRDSVPDVSCRIIHQRMIDIAKANRESLVTRLYTSQEKDFGVGPNVQVKYFKRSQWTNKEKQVDTALATDAVEDMILMKDLAGIDRTLILFSGDKDLTPVVDKAIKHGYHVEVWAFTDHLNQEMKLRAESAAQNDQDNPQKITFFPIDDIFDDITFTKYECKETGIPPAAAALVATISIPRATIPAGSDQERKSGILKHLVEQTSNIFKLPFVGRFQKNEKESGLEHLLLIGLAKRRLFCEKCQQWHTGSRYTYSNQQIKLLERELGKGTLQSIAQCITFTLQDVERFPKPPPCPVPTSTELELNNRFQVLDQDGTNVISSQINMNPNNTARMETIDFQLFQPQAAAPGTGSGYDSDEWKEAISRKKFRIRKGKLKKSKRQGVKQCKYGFSCHNPNCTFKHSPEELAYFQRSQKNMKLRGR